MVSETKIGDVRCNMRLNRSLVQLYNANRDLQLLAHRSSPKLLDMAIAQTFGHGNIKHPTEKVSDRQINVLGPLV